MSRTTSGSVAVPTASAHPLDESTIGRLEALKRSLRGAQPTAAPRPEQGQRGVSRSCVKAFRRTQAIRERYADGQPLDAADMAFMLKVLDQHPRAAKKIGPGVHAIVCGGYVGGSRCFWVVRTDGTIEDFSARVCLGLPRTAHRSSKLLAMMARFSTEPLRRAFLAYRRSGSAVPR